MTTSATPGNVRIHMLIVRQVRLTLFPSNADFVLGLTIQEVELKLLNAETVVQPQLKDTLSPVEFLLTALGLEQ